MNPVSLLLLPALLTLTGCYIGPAVTTFPPARTGQGIEVHLTTRGGSRHPAEQAGFEVLAVRDDGLLLRSLLLGADPLFFVADEVIEVARFPSRKQLSFGEGRERPASWHAELRLLSRFPQGVDEKLLRNLLSAYQQDSLRTIP